MSTIKEATGFKVVRERINNIIGFLEMQPEHTLRNPSGHAISELNNALGEGISRNAMHATLKLMQRYEWVMLDINGRKTMSVALVNLPEDYLPRVVAAKVVTLTDEGVIDPNLPLTEEPTTEEADAEAFADIVMGNSRAGRFAARLERNLGDIVDQRVSDLMASIGARMAEAFGASTEVTVVDETVAAQVHELEQQVNQLRNDLVYERAAAQEVRRERNELRSEKNSPVGSTLSPHHLPEAWRELARYAIGYGWTLRRTGGGHIEWRSPEGAQVFGPSTSSDWRAVRNHASDLYAAGLPKPGNSSQPGQP